MTLNNLDRCLHTDDVRPVEKGPPRLTLSQRMYLFWLWACEVAPAAWIIALVAWAVMLLMYLHLWGMTNAMAVDVIRLCTP